MPRVVPPYKRRRESFQLLKNFSLILVSFALGTTLKVSRHLFDASVSGEDGRKLSHWGFPGGPNIEISGALGRNDDPHHYRQSYTTTSPEPHRFSGAIISREERDRIRERVQAVEKRLQYLRSNLSAEQQKQLSTNIALESSQQQGPPSSSRRTEKDIQYCRDHVFTTQQTPVAEIVLQRTCNEPGTYRFDVCRDLVDFTGLTMEEVVVRMSRVRQFHFEEEHLFWNPHTQTELAWYYSASQSYLFANSLHGASITNLDHLQKGIHEPVLDYSGGVGNSVLYLASERGMKCQYFGIGMIEKAFAAFRVAKRGLQDKITILSPWSDATGWKFDPIQGPLPRDGTLGAILAIDVLEHIPKYHHVVAAMVDSLKVGGVIIENSPFAAFPESKNKVDTRIHVHHGGISMKEAMGDRMIFKEAEGYWEKTK